MDELGMTDDIRRMKTIDVYGKKLAARRNEIFRTQDEAASIAGMKGGSIGRIEQSDVAGVYRSSVPKLAQAYDLSVEDFTRQYVVLGEPLNDADFAHVDQATTDFAKQLGKAATARTLENFRYHVIRGMLVAKTGIYLNTVTPTQEALTEFEDAFRRAIESDSTRRKN